MSGLNSMYGDDQTGGKATDIKFGQLALKMRIFFKKGPDFVDVVQYSKFVNPRANDETWWSVDLGNGLFGEIPLENVAFVKDLEPGVQTH